MWEAILDGIFGAIQWFYGFVGDWGMSILIISIIFRLIIYPISHKQYKSTHIMNKLNPKIQEIQEVYKDDKMRQQQEMQRIYQEAHYNPLSGCLPLLIQMPIFIALFQTLQSISTRVEPGTVLSFYNILPDLSRTPLDVFNTNGIVASIPYFIFVAIFGLSIVVPLLLQRNSNQQTMTKVMMIFMACFMLYIGSNSPAGVLIFWDVSSIFGVATQMLASRYYKRKDAEEEALEIKPVEVKVVRKQKKARPTKKH